MVFITPHFHNLSPLEFHWKLLTPTRGKLCVKCVTKPTAEHRSRFPGGKVGGAEAKTLSGVKQRFVLATNLRHSMPTAACCMIIMQPGCVLQAKKHQQRANRVAPPPRTTSNHFVLPSFSSASNFRSRCTRFHCMRVHCNPPSPAPLTPSRGWGHAKWH